MNKNKGNIKLILLTILWLAMVGLMFLASFLGYIVVYYLPRQIG